MKVQHIRLLFYENLLIIIAILPFTQCKKDPANLTDPDPATPAISFTLNNVKYEYKSNGVKDVNGKVTDAFGYRVVNNLPVNDFKTYLEINGTSNNDAIKFSATYDSGLPLIGDNITYVLQVGAKSYHLETTVTGKSGNNYLGFFNGKTANFYQGTFSGAFLYFTALGNPQTITINDGNFLVTQAKDQ